MSRRKKSLFHKELDKRISDTEDAGKQHYTVEDDSECAAHTKTTEGHLESSRHHSLRRGRKKSNFQVELDRMMKEIEEEQTNCATADHTETKGNLIDGAELSGMYT